MAEFLPRGGATNHFIARAVERIGCSETEARDIAEDILWSIQQERWDRVKFIARVSRDGCRIFRFYRLGSQRPWYALVDTVEMNCVTVLPAGFKVSLQGKPTITLKGDDY